MCKVTFPASSSSDTSPAKGGLCVSEATAAFTPVNLSAASPISLISNANYFKTTQLNV